MSIQDFQAIELLVKSRKKFLNKTDDHANDDAYLESLRALLTKYSDSFTLLGAFESSSNQLLCFAGAYQHASTPTWSLLYVNNSISSLGSDSPLALLLNRFISDFESRKIYRFIYACPLRGESVYKNDNFTSLLARICPDLKKYSFFTAEVIEPGSFSKYDNHQKLIGTKPCQIKMAVRYAELNEKFRNLIN